MNVLILDYICVRDRGCGTRQPNWTCDTGGFCTLQYCQHISQFRYVHSVPFHVFSQFMV